MIADLAIAFAAGAISFVSTCTLPLVPAYVAWMGGQVGLPSAQAPLSQQLTVLRNAVLFVLGFTTAFVALGVGAGLLGGELNVLFKPIVREVLGVVLVVFGLSLLLLGRIPGLMRERRFDLAHRLPRTPWASYVIGVAFAVGWTPCMGPILGAILFRAGTIGTAGQGAILLAAYSLGLGVPFLAAAGLSGILASALSRLRRLYPALNAVAAVFLIAMGALIFTNRLTQFNDFFPVVSLTTPFDSHFVATTTQTEAPQTGRLRAGSTAPAFTLTDVDGNRVSLAALKGRPVLVTFWATWCASCVAELPLIKQAYLAHQAAGLTVVAINFGDESASTIRSYWAKAGLVPAPVLDPDETAADAFGVGLKSTGLPVSVFINRSGLISTYEPFPLTADVLGPALAKIL